MADNSLDSLLGYMEKQPVTEGWGAVSMFNRSRLNRLLEQQYIERFDGLGFMPPISGHLKASEVGGADLELDSIMLGQPLLSFNSASLINSTAVVTMNIVAGRYTTSHQQPGAEKVLLSTFNVRESQGFTLEMDLDLSLVVGEIDRQGKVTLNLSEGANFRCNLAGNDEAANILLGNLFKQNFEAIPSHRGVFELGMLDLKGYNHLTPKSFRILTQAAPGAKARGALNYGDGGVLVLIQLLGNTGPGTFPLPANFPYLIPDDKNADGSDKFSASLILSEAMFAYVENDNFDMLSRLLFPGENAFEELERHKRRDLGVFGNISPKQTLIALEPAFSTIKAGERQQFTLRNWKGDVIQASSWTAVSLRSHTAAGHGSIADGLYTTASPENIGYDSLHVVVTAKYVDAGKTYTASALLLVVFDSMTVAPRVMTCPTTAQSQPVVLRASTLDNAALNWKLRGPEYGSLTQSGDKGQFTANRFSKAKALAVQQIEATGTETRHAALVLVNGQQMIRVNPPYVPEVGKSVTVQLTDDPTLLSEIPRRWKVVGGGGNVDASGRFTAPQQGTTSSSVVQCEIVRNGVVFASGYSLIDCSELVAEETWKELVKFNIKVPNGGDGGKLGSLYPNGYQQLRAHILIETAPYNGALYPLSVIEKSTIALVSSTSSAQIPFVDEALEGIPEDDSMVWRTRLITNRFQLSIPRSSDAPEPSPRAVLGAVSELDIYIHTREAVGMAETFHVTFQASGKRWWLSTDVTDVNAKVIITPDEIPTFEEGDYTLQRLRVAGGSGGDQDPEKDDFDLHLRTIDYWTYVYTGRPGGLPGVPFETLEFLPSEGDVLTKPTSMIRWESEQLQEVHFSWTGYIFDDPQQHDILKKIKFDEGLEKIVLNEPLDIDVDSSYFAAGTLVISLHRSDRVDYVKAGDPARDKLTQDLLVLLIDKRGNAHKRRISFLPKTNPGSRNRILIGPLKQKVSALD